MGNASKPLIGLLVATVAFFALWVVALKPTSGSGGSSQPQGLGTYQSAINKAHQAVAISNGASAAHGGAVSSSPSAGSRPAASARHAVSPSVSSRKATAHPLTASQPSTSTPQQRLNVVQQALAAHKVVALLAYNPAAADDQAVRQELAAVPTDGGSVVKVAVPLLELAQYTVVTSQVPVSESPTLVIINPAQQATVITGFADGFEISQRIDEALSVK